MTPFPWAEAMQLGLGVLRLPPDQFWRMTPRELAAAITGLRGGATPPLGRAAFAELMRRYPDHQEQAR
ncbi:phage tail assembly chaperone [Rhodopseudomonas sp. P1]|uniref:rcc01693 family protein n=1 Tax=Rhodopseudomonas sp. P1 TaxID=3434357 RepID=UPI0031FD48FB